MLISLQGWRFLRLLKVVKIMIRSSKHPLIYITHNNNALSGIKFCAYVIVSE